MSQIEQFMRHHLKMRHLQLIVTLDELRSFSKAAATLHVTQPAVSKALSEIERGLGVSLFQRTTRAIKPTVEGVCAIRYGRATLQQLSLMHDELGMLASGTAGKVAVGVLPASAPALLPDSLLLLKQQASDTTVSVREGTMDTLLPELRAGRLDLIVGILPPRSQATDLDEKILFEDSTGLVVRKLHPLTKRRRLAWTDLGNYPWVLPPVNSLLFEPLIHAFQRHGVPMPQNYIETFSMAVILRHVQITDAIASLPRELALHYQRAGQMMVLPLEFSGLVRPVGMIWVRGRPLHAGLQLVMQCLEKVASRKKGRPEQSVS